MALMYSTKDWHKVEKKLNTWPESNFGLPEDLATKTQHSKDDLYVLPLLQSVMGITALIVNPLITKLIFSN